VFVWDIFVDQEWSSALKNPNPSVWWKNNSPPSRLRTYILTILRSKEKFNDILRLEQQQIGMDGGKHE